MLRATASLACVVLMISTALAQAPAPAPAPAPAAGGAGPQLTDFIGEQTALIGELDLKQLDPAAVETWLLGLMKQANVIAPAAPKGISEAEFHAGLSEAARWVADFQKAGGSRIYLIGGGDTLAERGPVIFAPATDENAKALASLLFSGKLSGPTTYKNISDPRNQLPRAEVVPGKGAAFGNGGAIAQIKTLKAANRPDFAAALKAIGDAPARLVLAPDPKFRAFMTKNMPPQILGKPSTLLAQDIAWAAAAIGAPPQAEGRVVVQAKDAASATALSEMITNGLTIMKQIQQRSGVKMTDQAIAAITPKVQGDQLVLSVDHTGLVAIAQSMSASFLRSRQVSRRVKSASNMRQLLQICVMYANDNKGAWPADFKALQDAAKKYANHGNFAQDITNPDRPEMNPAYVYVKSSDDANAGDRLVLYEAHKEFDDGVNVGFADGHVEFVASPQRFNDLLAKASVQTP